METLYDKNDTASTPTKICVSWEIGEPANPRNWSKAYKWWLTIQLDLLALTASLGSSIIAPSEQAITVEFRTPVEVSVLCISLYILGFAIGPLLWAPISEIWGRKWGILPAMAGLGLFSIGTATSTSIQSILVTRLFAGVCGSAPVSNVSAALGDIWAPDERGLAVAFYAGRFPIFSIQFSTNISESSRGGGWSYAWSYHRQRYNGFLWVALDRIPPGNLDMHHPYLINFLLARVL